MKVAVLLAYAVLTTRGVNGGVIRAPLDIISLDDISESERGALQFLNHHYHHPPRDKRSGEDALNSIKAAIGQGIKGKLNLIAKGSAAASSKLSKGSGSKGHSYQHQDEHPESHSDKSLDFWSLKKSILNTLLQAVKAIKGGVIAIKGQLIKGSGYLISAKGKLISSKGESISNLGKSIASSAVLSPTHGHSEGYSQGHYDHGTPEEYGSPSAPGPEYEAPEHHFHHHADKPDSGPAGILILKKIPSHEDHHSEHLTAEHKVPDFKPIDHSGPSFGEIIGKFFSASTSLTPGYPGPFGDDQHGHDHSSHSSGHDHHSSGKDHHSSGNDHHSSSSGHHSSDNDHHSSDNDHHSSGHGHHDYHSSHEDYHHVPHSSHVDSHHHEYSLSSHKHAKFPSHFEQAPDFLNWEYASESKKLPLSVVKFQQMSAKPEAQSLQGTFPASYNSIKPLTILNVPDIALNTEPLKVQTAPPVNYDSVRSAATDFSNIAAVNHNSSPLLLNSQIPQNLFDVSLQGKPTAAVNHNSSPLLLNSQIPQNLFEVSLQEKPTASHSQAQHISVPLPSAQPTRFSTDFNTMAFGAFPNSGVNTDTKFLAPPSDTQSLAFPRQNSFSDFSSNFPYPQSVKEHGFLDTAQLEVGKEIAKTPDYSKNHVYSGYTQLLDIDQSGNAKIVAQAPTSNQNHFNSEYTQTLTAHPEVFQEPVKRPTRSKNNFLSGYPQSVKNRGHMDNLQSEALQEFMKRPTRSKNSSRKRPPRPTSFPKPSRPDSPLPKYPPFTKTMHHPGHDRPKRL